MAAFFDFAFTPTFDVFSRLKNTISEYLKRLMRKTTVSIQFIAMGFFIRTLIARSTNNIANKRVDPSCIKEVVFVGE
jgi:hypothetical protein